MYMYMSCVYLYMYKGKEGGLERGRRGRLCGARTRTLVKLFCARFLSDSWHVQLPGRLRCWCGCGSVGGTPHRPASKSACRTRRREEFSEEIVIFRQFFLMVVQLHAAWALTLTELFRPALGHCHRRNCRAHGSLAARITADAHMAQSDRVVLGTADRRPLFNMLPSLC